ncbi:MAG: hypothetical protein OEL77_01790 [Nitrosopumilus sp.]|nr:hypothetical protein [Nitrosopumilus sp.]MDH3384727.1 hypothetical protein [Nitrosopumilus sp.]
MVEENFAGNIIVVLANLPDFLRTPILKKRMIEFFAISDPEKKQMINNALEAGPTIPFQSFSKLFKTWLEILTILPEDQRTELFSRYINEISESPQKLISFNLDGILEIFLSLDDEKQNIISQSVKKIISDLDDEKRRRLLIIIPDNAQKHLKF